MYSLGLNIVKLLTLMFCYDNQSVGDLARNPVFHSKSKHSELNIHHIKDKVLRKKLEVKHIPTKEQVVDILTKALSLLKFSYSRSKLNVINRLLSLSRMLRRLIFVAKQSTPQRIMAATRVSCKLMTYNTSWHLVVM